MAEDIAGALSQEFTRALRMLREAIRTLPSENWQAAEIDHLIPARQALHVVGAIDMYLRPKYVPGIADGADHFGRKLDWEGSSPEELPSQEEMLGYLDAMQDKLKEGLSKSDEELLAADDGFPWTGPNLLSRMLYLLGHCQHHQGVLHDELRRLGLPRPAWA